MTLLEEAGFCSAAAPLFEAGLVDAIEMDVDSRWGMGWDDRRLPPWAISILDMYSEDEALYGHGVWYSFLTAKTRACQDRWLRLLKRECKRRRYRHVSEHFGFFAGGEMARGPMLPLPFTKEVVRLGVERLKRIADACEVPVGLENAAAYLSPRDAREQGPLLAEILERADGFLVLDLHNLYTLAHNLKWSASELLMTYPLERVRELHISGGSIYRTTAAPEKPAMRLDSHDGPAPEGAFDLLPLALRHCPNVEVAFYERRELETKLGEREFHDDFLLLRAMLESHAKAA
jgi:hypothetical protein